MVLENFKTERKEYQKGSLDIDNCPSDPFELFSTWLDKAIHELDYKGEMVLSTIGNNQRPSSRVVLLKGVDKRGLRFFTNYKSRKGRNLDHNPFAGLNFYWPEFERQVRIEGLVEKLAPDESEQYFNSRPEEARISAIISPQSQQILNRDYLTKKHEELKTDIMEGKSVLNKPDYWGGYVLKPDLIEFWQGRPGRLNDRIEYRLEENNWDKKLLAP